MTTWYFVRPTDTLFVRGNLAFGEAGEHGTGLMPPPPSVFAGAFRSAILGLDAQVLSDFMAIGGRAGKRQRLVDERLHRCLGTPTAPGAFRVSWLSLAGQRHGAGDAVEALLPLPADLLWLGPATGFARLLPRPLPAGVASGGDLPLRATLQTPKQAKPEGGRYLSQAGWLTHLQGGPRLPEATQAIETAVVHQRDPRLGIGLNSDSRTAEEGLIYTTEGHAFSPASSPYAATGFLVGINGLDGLLPAQGHLRLGGDGRSAEYQRVEFQAFQPDTATIAHTGRFRLLLQTPGLFGGWLPPGCSLSTDGQVRLQGPGFSARLACAAVGRRDIVSGWDLHQWAPKPAEAAVPAGSVYWFDEFTGDPGKLAGSSIGKLAEWAAGGLRPDTAAAITPRHAEGWSQALLALWPHD